MAIVFIGQLLFFLLLLVSSLLFYQKYEKCAKCMKWSKSEKCANVQKIITQCCFNTFRLLCVLNMMGSSIMEGSDRGSRSTKPKRVEGTAEREKEENARSNMRPLLVGSRKRERKECRKKLTNFLMILTLMWTCQWEGRECSWKYHNRWDWDQWLVASRDDGEDLQDFEKRGFEERGVCLQKMEGCGGMSV